MYELINGNYMAIKEYNSQRVVTFKDIDTVHGRPEGTARRNFNQNKQRFIEGVDFFVVKPSDVQTNEFRTSEINSVCFFLHKSLEMLINRRISV